MAGPFAPPPFTQATLHASAPVPGAPVGTFAPGTKVQVGSHRVVIEKYLSEGGFAHVYLVRLPQPIDGDDAAVLKRVAVPDKDSLASMRTEVETMKKLKGHRHIVTYIDSHASGLKGGGYEVFLLMEYCNGGGLIDFMNTRLQNRLTEPEVLNIFADVAQGVACMHYLKPPLLHRDLKVENVLIRTSSASRRYKLCDFGSTAPPRPAAANAAEGRLIEDDVQKNTTLQYRSPEMIDVYRRQPIDEKSDIWALGVLLYKLCYYKTPFEEQGQMAILNASFKFPAYPTFSDRLKKLIALQLRERPQDRPNIFQVIKEVSSMRGTDVPIKDIYADRSHSEVRRNQRLPIPEPTGTSPQVVVGAFRAPPVKEELAIPDITPMRRGRPTRAEGDSRMPKPSPSPLRNRADDPFVALDAGKPTLAESAFDDASARFPALDDFSLLHDTGSKFAFDQPPTGSKKAPQNLQERVTNALADDAFAIAKPSPTPNVAPPKAAVSMTPSETKDNSTMTNLDPQADRQNTQNPKMVSTGTMTSLPPSPEISGKKVASRPIFRVPAPLPEPRSTSQPPDSHAPDTSSLDSRKRPGFPENRSKSQIFLPEATNISGPSLDVNHRASLMGGLDSSVHRSRSANAKARPPSLQGPANKGLFRRLSKERSNETLPNDIDFTKPTPTEDSDAAEEAIKIDSNVAYLKAKEEEESSKRKEKRLSSGSKHIKRSSIPSVSLSGTKNLLAGRFGDAFRRFEGNNEDAEQHDPIDSTGRGGSELTPIAGSEATDGRSDDGHLDESQEVPPEVRRELERRRLSQEEKRVADAAAAYKQRLAEAGDGARLQPNKKAISIQSKVKTLLDESGRGSPSPTKTAVGYGKYTDTTLSAPLPNESRLGSHPPRTSSRQIPGQPNFHELGSVPTVHRLPSDPLTSAVPLNMTPNSQGTGSRIQLVGSSASLPSTRSLGPPKLQPKPQALRTGDRPPQSPLKPASLSSRGPLGTRNPYQASSSTNPGQGIDSRVSKGQAIPADDDWENTFSKKYPDLSGLELVETEIDRERPIDQSQTGGNVTLGREMRVRDV